jgi:hypothetical protein
MTKTTTGTVRLTVTTHDLRPGDVVLTHGMRVEIPADGMTVANTGPDNYAPTLWASGRVLNPDDVARDRIVPVAWLYDDHRGGQRSEPRWTIQGNGLARWYVERGADQDGPVIITKDGRRIGHPRLENENAAWSFLLSWQGQSVQYALEHGGYAIVPVPVDRWSDLESREYRATASRCLHDHDHNASDRSRLTRENCGACVLAGYYPNGTTKAEKALGPNYGGWARIYVEAGAMIPAAWFDAFRAELATSDNDRYRDALAMSVATFGVTFASRGAVKLRAMGDGTWTTSRVVNGQNWFSSLSDAIDAIGADR